MLFVNAAGNKVFYPVLSDTDADIPFDPNITVKIPDNVKIGDIFPSEHGYERVIAISEDGAFVTELTDDDMVKTLNNPIPCQKLSLYFCVGQRLFPENGESRCPIQSAFQNSGRTASDFVSLAVYNSSRKFAAVWVNILNMGVFPCSWMRSFYRLFSLQPE